MSNWFKDKIEKWQTQHKLARQVDPHNIKRLAQEIRDMAILASQLNPRDRNIRQLIRNILVEMEQLSVMTNQPEFKRLSIGKRLLLRQGLKESREQLLESIESAPSPTDTLQ